jgi:hypothetical protein
VRQIDALLAALAQKALDRVAAGGEGGGRGGGIRLGGNVRSTGLRDFRASSPRCGLYGRDSGIARSGGGEGTRIGVLGIEPDHLLGALPNERPVRTIHRLFSLVKQ